MAQMLVSSLYREKEVKTEGVQSRGDASWMYDVLFKLKHNNVFTMQRELIRSLGRSREGW